MVNRKYYSIAPTEKQIAFVEEIKRCLHITNFPCCSKEYTKFVYHQFITAHLREYMGEGDERDEFEEDLYYAMVGDRYF